MRNILLFAACFFALSSLAGSHAKIGKMVVLPDTTVQDTLIVLSPYSAALRQLIVQNQDSTNVQSDVSSTYISPYIYQLVSPGTLYDAPLQQAFRIGQHTQAEEGEYLVAPSELTDSELVRHDLTSVALISLYRDHPVLVKATQKQLAEAGKVMKDVDAPIRAQKKMKEQVQLSELDKEDVDAVDAIVRKPNWWKLSGSNSLDLTQNYATDNWFQGKANHYNLLAIIAVDANYNNQRMIQWDNRLDLQLGFQSVKDSEFQKFRPTNNLLRLNSKLGIRAAKNWNYAFNVKAETQLVPNYNNYRKDGDKVKKDCVTDFLSPLNVDFSVGIDWKWNLKRFSGSLFMSPATYNLKYVERLDLATRYLGSDRKGHHTKHTFGPSATLRFKWKIAKNISWDSRLYWISNLKYTNIECENTITFSINKYLVSKFYFYPRYNDSNKNNRMPDKDGNRTDGTFWMFKEWLSLGISYNW